MAQGPGIQDARAVHSISSACKKNLDLECVDTAGDRVRMGQGYGINDVSTLPDPMPLAASMVASEPCVFCCMYRCCSEFVADDASLKLTHGFANAVM